MTETGAARCGCQEHEAATRTAGFSRRQLLRRAAAGGALAALAGPLMSVRTAYAATPSYTGDTLVVLSLRGGFDGLNVVAPLFDQDYAKARPTIGVPQSVALPLDGRFGLHPALADLHPFWLAGTMGVVHAVGQVNPTRSHFEAMEEMERAAPTSSLRTGWLDRLLGTRDPGTAFQGCQVGDATVSPGFAGPTPELGLNTIDGFTLSGSDKNQPLAAWDRALRTMYTYAPPTLKQPLDTTLRAVATTTALKAQGYTPAAGATYDSSSDLAMALRDVARLVKADVGLQVAAVDYGDWDMHSGMGAVDQGWLHDKLVELGAAVKAFLTDLGPLASRVTVVTLSEFGRRVRENGSGGVDHGHGNAVLVLGGSVVGGEVRGTWPGLGPAQLVDGDLAGTTDYRDLLAEVLVRRCGLSASDVRSVFPGLTPSAVGIVRAA